MQTFDELRKAMRIAPKAWSQGMKGDGMDTDMETIEANVRRFRQRLADDPKRAADQNAPFTHSPKANRILWP